MECTTAFRRSGTDACVSAKRCVPVGSPDHLSAGDLVPIAEVGRLR
jgi:hypothetical protein